MIASIVAGSSVLAPREAWAQDTALILSYVGQKAPTLALYEKAVAEALPAIPLWGAQLAATIDSHLGEQPKVLTRFETFKADVQKTATAMLLGQRSMESGIQALEGFRRVLSDSPGTFASEPEAADVYKLILLSLARAYLKKEHPAPSQAEGRIAEFIEAFPSQAPDSPMLNEVYQRVSQTNQSQRRSSFRIEKSDPAATLYVNGRAVVCPSVCMEKLPRGEYSVFVSTAAGDGRVHHVPIGDADVSLALDASFETAISTERFVGLRFSDGAAQQRSERRYAEKLGAAIGVRQVLALSETIVNNTPGLRLAAYAIGGGRESPTSVEMLGGVLTPSNVAELSRRLVGKLPGMAKSNPSKAVASATTPATKAPTAPANNAAAPTTPGALLAAAQSAYAKGDFTSAIANAEECIRAAPSSELQAQARRTLGASHCGREDKTAVMRVWQTADDSTRAFLRYVCGRHAIALP